MVRIATQILAGIMLIFGFMTLLPKAYIEFKARRTGKGVLYAILAILALYFSVLAFLLAYDGMQKIL